jgi:formylglycine-generating enzyme required for sulfatase activity
LVNRVADSDTSSGRPAGDASADELARALGMKGVPTEGEGLSDAARKDQADADGPLRLDKDGALIGRPKLSPVRALRDAADAEQDAVDAAEEEGPERPRKAVLPPKLALLRPPELDDAPPEAQDPTPARLRETVEIPAGEFRYGEEGETRELPAFEIDRYPVTNAQYEVFVRATGHRPPLYWRSGHLPPELENHPVVGVDYFDALAYARFKGKDLPFEDEWERAARGTDGRTYPWGETTEFRGANTARSGVKSTTPVDAFTRNRSPDGVCDTVGNCWELTHSPAPGGGVVVRGGSWYDFALYAKTWFRFASRADARNGTIGFRLVSRSVERPDAPREIDPTHVEAELVARTGPQPLTDRDAFSADRRDLIPERGRIESFLAELASDDPGGAPIAPGDTDLAEGAVAALPEKPAKKARPRKPSAKRQHVEDQRAPIAEKPVTPEVAPTAPESSRDAPTEAGVDLVAQRAALARAETEALRAQERAHMTGDEPAAPTRTPYWMWGALLVGFLLVGYLGYRLVATDGPPEETTLGIGDELPDLVDPALGLPPLPGFDAEDIRPLRLLDLGADGTREALRDGAWLYVFLDPRETESKETVLAAHKVALHLHDTSVRVALVVPPALRPEEGDEADRVLAFQREYAVGLNGLTVVFDDEDELRGQYLGPDVSVGAVVSHRGRGEMALPALPDRAIPFASLAPLAARAYQRYGQ